MSNEILHDEASTEVLNFLKANVPKTSLANIESDLRKDFLLAKKRSKDHKKRTKKRKLQTLTRDQKRALGFYNFSRQSVKYCDVLPLNEIWTEYITEVLELEKVQLDFTGKSWEQLSQSFYRADFHGSILHVVRSRCPSYVGKSGVCIMDTKNTFKLVSKNDVITTIPKKECVFEIKLKNNLVLLYGKHLCTRPAERSVKKIKSHIHPDL
ncbi:ribonuclease P protein subunit p29 [Aricia agestis]|uniref:ribonuclease P protein subunit p29 n=1 Tax=Aricia agestis TaxID=91739 RepID=UPI001C207252|nr:ribonuclease P protein subunit p29 [Aricia agestis]